MRVCHGVATTFDDPNLVSCAGLAPVWSSPNAGGQAFESGSRPWVHEAATGPFGASGAGEHVGAENGQQCELLVALRAGCGGEDEQ